jgi:hypothetical protein
MRVRLRYVLPIVMVLVTVALEWWSREWFLAHRRIDSVLPFMSGIEISINLPATILREILYGHRFLGRYFVWFLNICVGESSDMRMFIDYAITYPLIVISWFAIGWYIDLCLKRGSLVTFKRHRQRLVLDLILIAALIWLGLWGVELARMETGYQMYASWWAIMSNPDWRWGLKWRTPVLVIRSLWFVIPIYLFARDAVLCVMEWRKASAG